MLVGGDLVEHAHPDHTDTVTRNAFDHTLAFYGAFHSHAERKRCHLIIGASGRSCDAHHRIVVAGEQRRPFGLQRLGVATPAVGGVRRKQLHRCIGKC